LFILNTHGKLFGRMRNGYRELTWWIFSSHTTMTWFADSLRLIQCDIELSWGLLYLVPAIILNLLVD